ncbi:hypothetical protein KFE25_002537 [Diacronema lutheri]|uniref:Uncharacterized protein n=1 Tax=Diacronema lutheri TaxID=2081491 RepID=A0A8J5XGM9_DIALT|nr:hypothetical protein KFE25_002537 [Diacronema lutheri]
MAGEPIRVCSLLDRLDDACVTCIARQLTSTLELSAASQVCTDFRRACEGEAERRCRALIAKGWSYTGDDRPARRHRYDKVWRGADDEHAEMIAYAASRAGGWIVLLAGREGLLDTEVEEAKSAESPRFAGIASWVVIWDISTDEDGLVSSCIMPLAHHLGRPGRPMRATYIFPDDGGRRTMRAEPFRRFPQQIAGPLGDTRTWRVKPCVFGDGFSESSLHPLFISAQAIARLPPHGADSVLGSTVVYTTLRDAGRATRPAYGYHLGPWSAGWSARDREMRALGEPMPDAMRTPVPRQPLSPYYELLLCVTPHCYVAHFRLEVPCTVRTWQAFARRARQGAALRAD